MGTSIHYDLRWALANGRSGPMSRAVCISVGSKGSHHYDFIHMVTKEFTRFTTKSADVLITTGITDEKNEPFNIKDS
jgi:hypothetical protein